jgi:hypothetical protein
MTQESQDAAVNSRAERNGPANPRLAFDATLAEVRSKFAEVAPENLESLIDEGVAAVRGGKEE